MTTNAPNSQGILRWLWRGYMVGQWPVILLASVFMAIEGSMLGVMSYMMKPMFDNVFLAGNTSPVFWVGLIFLAIFALRGIASVMQKFLLSYVAEHSVAKMRNDMVAHLMRLDVAYHLENPPGILMQRVTADVEQIANVWKTFITGAGRDVISVIALFGVAIWVDWKWTLVALLGVPLLVLPSTLLQRFVRKNAREARDVSATLSTRLNEIFHGVVPIKLNAMEQYQSDRYADLTKVKVRTQVRAAVGQASIPGLIDIMAGLGFMGVLWFGGAEIIAGEKTVGDFMAFFAAIGFAFEPLRRLGALAGLWQVAAAAIERVREILETEPKLVSPAAPVAIPSTVPALEFADVHLSYGETQVLRGLTFFAEAGKTTALVGASGAGKSTVFNVLTRLVDADQGQAMIDGQSVKAFDLSDLRALFSVVSQDALLFDETLRENIILGREDVSNGDLAQAAEAAFVTDFAARLPKGLETEAGPRGANLSGGQRQRIAIARAVLRNTPILLLDEATSALDAQSETKVQEALEALSKGRTTLVIAHRLSTVRNADKIIVMDAGRVVEEGTHEELIAKGGAYAELYRLQFADQTV